MNRYGPYGGTFYGGSVYAAPVAVDITTDDLPPATIDVPYSFQLQAIGGLPPYTWTLIAGTLPTGITLSSSGEISGTHDSQTAEPITVRVTDARGDIAERSYLFNVFPPHPVITTPPLLPLAIVGQPYSVTLEAEDGALPYTWAVIAGDLPPGLTLDEDTGEISGTPTTDGVYVFTVEVTDDVGQTGQQTFTINALERIPVRNVPSYDSSVESVVNEAQTEIVTRAIVGTPAGEIAIPWRATEPILVGAGQSVTLVARDRAFDQALLIGAEVPDDAAGDYMSGTPWALEDSTVAAALNSLQYGGGQWIAVGGSDIITSPDGEVWTQQTLPPITGIVGLTSVRYNGSTWIAVGLGGLVLTSPDAVTWTQRTTPSSPEEAIVIPGDPAYGDGRWIIPGINLSVQGIAITSLDDGVTWAPLPLTGSQGWLESAVYTGEPDYTWLIVGRQQNVLYSDDGVTWAVKPAGGFAGQDFREISYDAATGRVLAVGPNSVVRAGSVDPATWVNQQIPSSAIGNYFGAAIRDGVAFAVGNLTNIVSNLAGDSTSWMHHLDLPVPNINAIFNSVATDGDRWIVVGQGGVMISFRLVPLADVSLGRTSGASIPITLTAGAEDVLVSNLRLRSYRVIIEDVLGVRSRVDAGPSILEHGRRAYTGRVRPDITLQEAQDNMDAVVRWLQDGRGVVRFDTLTKQPSATRSILDRDIGDRLLIDIPALQVVEDGDDYPPFGAWIVRRADGLPHGHALQETVFEVETERPNPYLS